MENQISWECYFWQNEELMYEIPWVNGQIHGIETNWHENGQKWIERSWVNGLLHGIETGWYKNGQKWSERSCVNGRLHGLSIWWTEDGSLRSVQKWNQAQLVVGFEFKISEVPEGRVPEIDVLRNEFKLL
jgi:antitoxin component YwqK of YwqJK toxin-antitoxin module